MQHKFFAVAEEDTFPYAKHLSQIQSPNVLNENRRGGGAFDFPLTRVEYLTIHLKIEKVKSLCLMSAALKSSQVKHLSAVTSIDNAAHIREQSDSLTCERGGELRHGSLSCLRNTTPATTKCRREKKKNTACFISSTSQFLRLNNAKNYK